MERRSPISVTVGELPVPTVAEIYIVTVQQLKDHDDPPTVGRVEGRPSVGETMR